MTSPESEPQDPRDAEEKFIRWAPLAVPLSAALVIAGIGLIWWSVL